MMRRAICLLVGGTVLASASWGLVGVMKPSREPLASKQSAGSKQTSPLRLSHTVFSAPSSSSGDLASRQKDGRLTDHQHAYVAPGLGVLDHIEERAKALGNQDLLERAQGEREKLVAIASRIDETKTQEGGQGR